MSAGNHVLVLSRAFIFDKPLETIYGNHRSKPSARIECWVLRLQPYSFKVEYRSGDENHANYMSRHLANSHVTEVFQKVQNVILVLSRKLFFHKLRLIFRLIECIVGGIETCDNSKETDANL